MADFEGLIRQALASHNAADPAVRQRIYQSSRNALAKMLDKTGDPNGVAARQHVQRLENSIARIERAYAPEAEPQPVRPAIEDGWSGAAEPALEPDQDGFFTRRESPSGGFSSARQTIDPDEPEPLDSMVGDPSGMAAEEWAADDPSYVDELGDPADFAPEHDDAPRYQRENPILRRLWPIAVGLAVILVVLWIIYAVLTTLQQNEAGNRPGAETGEAGEGSAYVTLLEPTNLSSLVTADRGKADLITVQNTQMLRLVSVREPGSEENASPILLRFEPGVVRQVAGKEVTVEMRTKSGSSGPAQFAVECLAGGDSICGRKRFRVGLQPEDTVFKLDLGSLGPDGEAALAINTDVTAAATSSGEGDAIDVLYIRLRVPGL